MLIVTSKEINIAPSTSLIIQGYVYLTRKKKPKTQFKFGSSNIIYYFLIEYVIKLLNVVQNPHYTIKSPTPRTQF